MKDVIQEELQKYNRETIIDEENAIKEITQEIILYGLQQVGFFEKASFLGGTCLRIIHGLDRFSEDLDFSLKEADPNFDLVPYIKEAMKTLKVYGYELEIFGEDKVDQNVKMRFIKDDSIKKLLQFQNKLDLRKKIQIKIEIDIMPPTGAIDDTNFITFPTETMISTHDTSSLLAGKCHALLCRNYIKGRDWYDYLWYIKNNTKVNFRMLQESIHQIGPWEGKDIKTTPQWLQEELEKKIKSLDWNTVKEDVGRFLSKDKKINLNLWSENFFLKMTKKFINCQE